MVGDLLSNLNIRYYYGAKTACGQSWHGYHCTCTYSKLYYILSGECVIETAQRKYIALPGQLFLIPAGLCHSFYQENENHVTKHWLHFDLEAGGQTPFGGGALPLFWQVDKPHYVAGLFKAINQAPIGPGELLLQKAKIMELVAYFICSARLCESEDTDTLAPVKQYIHTHLQNPLKVGELAELLHLHPNYFIRIFKTATGLSPMKYIRFVKIERAKSLLETTDKPVCDIAAELGFADQSHFSHFFKSNCGISAGQFRAYYKKAKT